MSTLRSLEIRVQEYLALLDKDDVDIVKLVVLWKAPAPGFIRFNFDAAVKSTSTSIAVVARDASGFVCKAWTKHVDTKDPLIAEALAIKWALELAQMERYPNIIVESALQ